MYGTTEIVGCASRAYRTAASLPTMPEKNVCVWCALAAVEPDRRCADDRTPLVSFWLQTHQSNWGLRPSLGGMTLHNDMVYNNNIQLWVMTSCASSWSDRRYHCR